MATESVATADQALAEMAKPALKGGDPSPMLPLLSNGMRPGWSKFQGGNSALPKGTNGAIDGAAGAPNSGVERRQFPKEGRSKSAWDGALKGSGKPGEAAVGLRAEMVASKLVVRERRALDIRNSIKRVDKHGNETLNKVSCHHG